jgi:hypothetical protein
VIVPAGDVIWSGGVTISKSLTLIGTGVNITSGNTNFNVRGLVANSGSTIIATAGTSNAGAGYIDFAADFSSLINLANWTGTKIGHVDLGTAQAIPAGGLMGKWFSVIYCP